jgi:hypothetical protein
MYFIKCDKKTFKSEKKTIKLNYGLKHTILLFINFFYACYNLNDLFCVLEKINLNDLLN